MPLLGRRELQERFEGEALLHYELGAMTEAELAQLARLRVVGSRLAAAHLGAVVDKSGEASARDLVAYFDDPEALAVVARSPRAALRAAAAQNKHTPRNVLQAMAEDRSEVVRAAVNASLNGDGHAEVNRRLRRLTGWDNIAELLKAKPELEPETRAYLLRLMDRGYRAHMRDLYIPPCVREVFTLQDVLDGCPNGCNGEVDRLDLQRLAAYAHAYLPEALAWPIGGLGERWRAHLARAARRMPELEAMEAAALVPTPALLCNPHIGRELARSHPHLIATADAEVLADFLDRHPDLAGEARKAMNTWRLDEMLRKGTVPSQLAEHLDITTLCKVLRHEAL